MFCLVSALNQSYKSLMHLAKSLFDTNLRRNYEIHHVKTQGSLTAFCLMSVFF